MQRFNRILFVTNGLDTAKSAFAHAALLAETNHADLLTVMDIGPRGGKANGAGSNAEVSDAARMPGEGQRFLVSGSAILESQGSPRVEFETDRSLSQVIDATREHDVVIKPVGTASRGCADEDCKLLRHSICPVWITRRPPLEREGQSLRILAAFDLTPVTSSTLARVVVAQASSLAEGGEYAALEFASTWQIPHELELRGRIKLTKLRKQMKKSYSRQLDSLVENIQLPKSAIHLLHGEPRRVIPDFVKQQGFDLVVVGERSGLMQFVTGNTAERLLADGACSVLSINENITRGHVH